MSSQPDSQFAKLPDIAPLDCGDLPAPRTASPLRIDELLGSQFKLGSQPEGSLNHLYAQLSPPELGQLLGSIGGLPSQPQGVAPTQHADKDSCAAPVAASAVTAAAPLPALVPTAPLFTAAAQVIGGPVLAASPHAPVLYIPTTTVSMGTAVGLPALAIDPKAMATAMPPHPSLQKEEHRHSKANRRGPMDEMRQLIRILVRLMPDSSNLLTEDGGGGNRVSETQIQSYLKKCLGEAPKPIWGCPTGWGAYLSELFTWVLGRTVTKDEAMRCARRLPGRSWETVEEELVKMGLYPASWPLPLAQKAAQAANLKASGGCTADAASGGVTDKQVSASPSHSTRNVAETLHLMKTEIDLPCRKKRRKVDVTASSPASTCQAAGVLTEAPASPRSPEFRCASDTVEALPSVEDCWRTAQRALQDAVGREGTASEENYAELAALYESVGKLWNGSALKFFLCRQQLAGTSGAGAQGPVATGQSAGAAKGESAQPVVGETGRPATKAPTPSTSGRLASLVTAAQHKAAQATPSGPSVKAATGSAAKLPELRSSLMRHIEKAAESASASTICAGMRS